MRRDLEYAAHLRALAVAYQQQTALAPRADAAAVLRRLAALCREAADEIEVPHGQA